MAITFYWFVSERLTKIRSSKARYPKSTPQVALPLDRQQDGFIAFGQHLRPKAKSDDHYTIMLVTCYSEGEEGIRNTVESLASTDYPDTHKLLFVVADGLITGFGNSVSTPDAIIGMISQSEGLHNPEPRSYLAIAHGAKQHNMAKVYAGHYYHSCGGYVPVIAIVKCGTLAEQNEPGQKKAGNRGKRDSQLILMNFLSRVMFNDRMTPLDYELSWKIPFIAGGITPDLYTLVLMVDADTKVAPDSLKYMVQAMKNDPTVMGLCGETRIANKRTSWITAIQVFEYYISHHLGKAFESVFGGVTCLPGCFCMYRIKAPKGPHGAWTVPILANPDIVDEYSENIVDTLHKKNLLLLGEDRFLTTLIMQFIVMLELIGTVVLPAAITFVFVLLLSAMFTGKVAVLPLLMLLATLGLPGLLIIITTRKVVYLLWMVIYILALPIWNFVLPVYAFWHFDDFTWGETRKVEGESAQQDHSTRTGEYEIGAVVLKKWADWEVGRRGANAQTQVLRRQQEANSVIMNSEPADTVEQVAQSLQNELNPPRLANQSRSSVSGFNSTTFQLAGQSYMPRSSATISSSVYIQSIGNGENDLATQITNDANSSSILQQASISVPKEDIVTGYSLPKLSVAQEPYGSVGQQAVVAESRVPKAKQNGAVKQEPKKKTPNRETVNARPKITKTLKRETVNARPETKKMDSQNDKKLPLKMDEQRMKIPRREVLKNITIQENQVKPINHSKPTEKQAPPIPEIPSKDITSKPARSLPPKPEVDPPPDSQDLSHNLSGFLMCSTPNVSGLAEPPSFSLLFEKADIEFLDECQSLDSNPSTDESFRLDDEKSDFERSPERRRADRYSESIDPQWDIVGEDRLNQVHGNEVAGSMGFDTQSISSVKKKTIGPRPSPFTHNK
ncbi:Chitin synthase, class 3 [Phlyctochytrium planicorne]|nr:Chitin synthase, class 3 [Phlyctochytrium planicorne]